MFDKTDIYKFTVPGHGDKPYYLDPLMLRRKALIASSGRCWEWVNKVAEYDRLLEGAASTPDPEAARAEFSMRQAELEGKLVQVAFETFDLVPIDDNGHGVTELAGLEILYDFLDWLDQKKSPPVT